MTLGKIAVGLVLGALLIYGAFEALPLLRGPSITIDAPEDGASIPGGFVTVRGTVLRAATFMMNGAPVLRDETGAFSVSLAYPAGTSILTFTAKDRFGRIITRTLTIHIPD